MRSNLHAQEDYLVARRKALWNEIISFLRGRPNQLLSWEEVRDKLHIRGQIYRGVTSVPVSQIVGSVGRYKDFDRVFLPKQDKTANRWRSIARAYYDEVSLPPVKLYKVGEAYFVLDGNHRVSVARERSVTFMDAEVIEAAAKVPVTEDLDASDLEIKGEYADFLERTHCDDLLPGVRIEFTIAGGYARLIEHIAVHRYFMGLEQEGLVSEDQAVLSWYENLYRPLAEIVLERGTLAEFPGRTEADLYLWIMDHQHYLRERFGGGVEIAAAAEHFADHYTMRPIKRVLRTMRGLVTGQDAEDTFIYEETGSDTE
jgi:hypothetical protein